MTGFITTIVAILQHWIDILTRIIERLQGTV